MNVQKPDMLKLASLANLTITQEEAALFAHYFDDLLDFFDGIGTVEPGSPILSDATFVLRKDAAFSVCDRAELLANAKAVEDGCVTVPKVMEEL